MRMPFLRSTHVVNSFFLGTQVLNLTSKQKKEKKVFNLTQGRV